MWPRDWESVGFGQWRGGLLGCGRGVGVARSGCGQEEVDMLRLANGVAALWGVGAEGAWPTWMWPEVGVAGSGRGHGVVAMLPLASRRSTSMRPRMGGEGGGFVHGGCVPPRGRGRKRAWPEVGVTGCGPSCGVVAMLPLASRRITSMRPRMGGEGGGYVHGGCVPPRGRGRKRA